LNKNLLRRKILTLRRAQSFLEIEEKSKEIERNLFLFPLFNKAKVVLFYLALKDEVQTREMIKKSLREEKTVLIPFANFKEREILPSELKDYDKELIRGKWNILKPAKDFYRPFSLNLINLIIVPGIAFDRKGNRIGFGKGFYDRFLRKISPEVNLISLAFELQLVEDIPAQSYDIPMDYIITEKGIINCLEERNEKKLYG